MNKSATTLLRGQEVGQFITSELSEYLKKYTGSNERAAACTNSGVGIHTINYLVTRKNTLTEGNYPGLVELVRIAIAKCESEGEQAEAAKEHMESLIQE